MRYLALFALVAALCVVGCGKKETTTDTDDAVESQSNPPAAASKPASTKVENPQWVELNSGVSYRDLEIGSGDEVKNGQMVLVHYKGWLEDGTVFDTSKKPGGSPFDFQVGQGYVIDGWDIGVLGMKVGGKRELKIPPQLGYGESGQGPIPPNSTLYFEVEVLATEPA